MTQMIKNLLTMQDTGVQFPSQEYPLEKGMATPLYSSCLENLMEEELGGLQSMGSQRVGHV